MILTIMEIALWITLVLHLTEGLDYKNETDQQMTLSLPNRTTNNSHFICTSEYYQCWDGTCIEKKNFCDGVDHCPDNSDEFDYEFLMAHLHNQNVKASILPCTPPSDGEGQNKTSRPCALMNTWICDGVTGQCVGDNDEECWSSPTNGCFNLSSALRCNGFINCMDKSDEENCTRYQCASSNTSVLEKQICDGAMHCPDTSDECFVGCSYECYCPLVFEKCDEDKLCQVAQPEHCLYCQGTQSRYKLSQLCDGKADCSNEADETNCTKFLCNNGKEIWQALTCDAVDDCGDTSDECDCTSTFLCENLRCISVSQTCNGVNDCGDHSDECFAECESNYKYTCNDGQCISASSFCDDKLDCRDESDEVATVPSISSSTSTTCDNLDNPVKKTCFLQEKNWMCDMSDHCLNRSDECLPDCRAQSFWCKDNTCIKVEDFCNGITDCPDGSDEIQYTSSVSDAIACTSVFDVKQLGQCALPINHPWVCDAFTHCWNFTDECTPGCSTAFRCYSGECIDRSWMCDGDEDCMDGSDEQASAGDVFQCVRTRRKITRVCHLPINIAKDNVADCDRNMDLIGREVETTSKESEALPKHRQHGLNRTLFQCIGESRFIPGEKQCDGVFNCPLLSDECMCENATALCQNICYDNRPLGDTSWSCYYCGVGDVRCGDNCISRYKVCDGHIDCPGGEDEEFCIANMSCPEGRGENCIPGFKCDTGLTKKKNNLFMAHECDGKPQCINLEDECSDRCQLLKGNLPEYCNNVYLFHFYSSRKYFNCNEGRRLINGLEVCDGLSKDCPGGEDEANCPDRIYCEEEDADSGHETSQVGAIHIDKSQICDGKIDCATGSDELNCSSHFYCEGGSILFVPKRAMGDGKDDCMDGSDECPSNSFNESVFSSREMMIKAPLLRLLIWVMGTLSVFGNMFVLMETVYGLVWAPDRFKNKRAFAKVNHVLVINLASADLLMGIYLIVLGTEATLLSGSYCHEDKLWRSSNTCNFLGVLTIVSSETSVLILLILTSYRLYGVFRPFKCKDVSYIWALCFAGLAWVTSLTLALLPVAVFSSYYISHAWIKHNRYFLKDVVSKGALLEFLSRHRLFYGEDLGHGNIRHASNSSIDCWNDIKSVMTSTFGDDAIRGEFGYYSHVSVCMPKLYVTKDDVAWEHAMVIIIFNCIAFTYISAAYAFIFFRSVNTMSTRSSKRQRSMFRRISYLVATDLACWLPICAMAFVSFAGHEIPENAYAFSAVVLLPINSALNPILYSNVVQKSVAYAITCGKKKAETLQTSFREAMENARDFRNTEKSRLNPPSRDASFRGNGENISPNVMIRRNNQCDDPDVVPETFLLSPKQEEEATLKDYMVSTSKF